MLTPKKQVTILFSVATNMTLLKRLQEEARKQARWLHALIELKDVENSLDGITANTVTAVLDEIESEARDLYLESDNESYQRALTDIRENVVKPLYGKK